MSEDANKNWLDRWVGQNSWAILMIVAATLFWSATLKSTVDQTASKVLAVENKVSSLQSLVERVIVLEENRKSVVQDIDEIKGDIKEIKSLLK